MDSEQINSNNVRNIQAQIIAKKGSNPYYATGNYARGVVTDFDVFPYTRWYRGIPNTENPTVAEREAGWRNRYDDCYKVSGGCGMQPSPYPNHCFEAACSTVFPCYPQYLSKNSDRDQMNIILNRGCVAQYR